MESAMSTERENVIEINSNTDIRVIRTPVQKNSPDRSTGQVQKEPHDAKL